MANSPFKFLDSYTSDDRDIFFGREREIEELYYKILDGNLLIVYGSSGTGKTSLLQCGLAGKFDEADWMPVIVRRAANINQSLKKNLQSLALIPLSEKNSLVQNIKSVYLDYFKPLFFIFDQFEELFIFGTDEEIETFADDLHLALNAGLSCKFIFVIRSEYLEHITRFEEKIPDFFNNRIRIERMTRQNAMRVITEPCKLFNISVGENFPEKILERLASDKSTVELTYLQVYLDKLYKKAVATHPMLPVFNEDLLKSAGYIEDVLAEFLDEQIANTKSPEDALTILKSFVSAEGTKKQMSVDETLEFTKSVGKDLSRQTIEDNIRQFVDLRILKDMDENGKYELRHDALAAEIYKQISSKEKEMLEVRQFLINRFSDFQKRSILLDDSDLEYILPYEKKLYLDEAQKLFIEKSRRSVRQRRNRRRNIAAGTGLGLILLLSGFTLFAVKQRNDAIAQTKIAVQKTQEAINQKEIAEKSKEMAMDASKEAMDAKSYAELQSKIADEQKKIAEQQAMKAQEQTQFASTQQSIAIEQKQFAEEKSKEALQQKQKADSAKSEANRLRLLSLSQTIAFKSLESKDDRQLSALLACESFRLSEANGGNTQDPELYSALYENLKNIDPRFRPQIIRSKGEIKSVANSSAGQNILVLSADGLLNTYSGSDYSLVNSTQIPASHSLNTGYISSNGKFVLTAYDDYSIILFNTEKGIASPSLSGHNGLVRAAAFSSDGSLFASGGRDSTLIIWSNNSAQKKIHFDARIRTLSMGADNSTIAAGCEDGKMYLVNISSADKKLMGNNSPARIQSAAFSRQGNFVGFGSSNGLINLYGANKNILKTLAENTTSIDFLALDENLKVLVAASGNKILQIYSMSDLSMKPIVIKDMGSPIVSLSLSPDGKILVGCSDNTIRQFAVKSEHLQNLLLTYINRNLTSEEWNTFIGSDVPYEKTKSDQP